MMRRSGALNIHRPLQQQHGGTAALLLRKLLQSRYLAGAMAVMVPFLFLFFFFPGGSTTSGVRLQQIPQISIPYDNTSIPAPAADMPDGDNDEITAVSSASRKINAAPDDTIAAVDDGVGASGAAVDDGLQPRDADLDSGDSFPAVKMPEKCKLSIGEWIHDVKMGALYKNLLSCSIFSNGCKLGKNNLNWRWKPNGCVVQNFKAAKFLQLMKNKWMAFVGDNLAKAQMESLLCLISEVESPKLVYDDKTNQSSRWHVDAWNMTITMVWSPYWVEETSSWGYRRLSMDNLDIRWAEMAPHLDVLVLASSQWLHDTFLKEPAAYVVQGGGRVVGCHACNALKVKDPSINYNVNISKANHNITAGKNSGRLLPVKEMSPYTGFRAAVRSCILGVRGLPGFTGVTLFFQPYTLINKKNKRKGLLMKKMSTTMKAIQEEELLKAHLRLAFTNQAPIEVLATQLNGKLDPLVSVNTSCFGDCGVPPPIFSLTWNQFMLQRLERLLSQPN